MSIHGLTLTAPVLTARAALCKQFATDEQLKVPVHALAVGTGPLTSVEDPRKRLQVTPVAVLFSQRPVLGAPKQVRIQRKVGLARPAQALVVIVDNVFRAAAVHRVVPRTWWSGHCFPRLRLTFTDH